MFSSSHSKKKVRAFRRIGNNFFPTVKTALWRCSTPYPRLTSFDGKGTPFVYLILKNRTPLTYLVKTFASLLTAVKALSLKTAKSQNQNVFSFFFTAINFICLPFWTFLLPKMTYVSTLPYASTNEIPPLS